MSMLNHTDFFTRKKNELGVSLNDVQKQAVKYTQGALLLLASPGSGKTTTIIMRIGYLIEEKGVDPSRIKAVTFSRAAAQDMKERFKRFFPEQPEGAVKFSTIHSFAFEVVRHYFHVKGIPYQIIEGDVTSEEESGGTSEGLPLHKKLILRDLYRRIHQENITDEHLDELTTYISYIKNKMLPESQWAGVKCEVPEAEQILRLYEDFKQHGASKLLVDFDDMLVIANTALEEQPQLLRRYQRRYDYVLTDESQDTSLVQHAIIEKLARAHGNLCVVADDDQSIYAWRAAEPEYLLRFKEVYPRARILKMEQNYRSSRNIVGVSNQFIKRNKNRYEKNMFTRNAPYQPIRFKQLTDHKYQARYLSQQLENVEQLNETAILYRNNSSSITIMNEFDRAGIPFYMRDGDQHFFSHFVVEDILNFMRMAYTDKRPDLLERIHMKFNAYISKQQMARLHDLRNNESVFDNLLQHVPVQDYQKKRIPECKQAFEEMREMPPDKAIRVIRYKLGYEKALEKMCERLGFRKETLLGILNTLEDIADSLTSLEDFAKRLKHLETVMKTSKFNKNKNAVTFSTLHSAKGLEFERVYMIDLIDGIIPSSEDIKKAEHDEEAEMEEAVRLFYVGMTRAKKHLELLSYKTRDGASVKESRFVTHVRNIQQPASSSQTASKRDRSAVDSTISQVTVKQPQKPSFPRNPHAITSADQLHAGLSVRHRVFGVGKIIGVQAELVEISFEVGPKKLSLKACLEMGLLEPETFVPLIPQEN